MRYFGSLLLLLAGCIYFQGPGESPPVEPVGPNGITEYKFNWGAFSFYAAQLVAAIRWAVVEYKHYKLVKAGKKDANRDGQED